MSLLVNEIFYSLQGESTYSGRPCVFIRLTGCNLRCSYCDTRYAYDEGIKLRLTEIHDRIKQYRCSLVEVTGGEPLAQIKTPDLVDHLINNGYEVLMETNGSLDINLVSRQCIRIMDIKCPSSGESHHFFMENLAKLENSDQVKFVIENREDYEYAREIVGHMKSRSLTISSVNFSPVFGQLEPENLAEWILADHLACRLHLQIHKYIWGPDVRGV